MNYIIDREIQFNIQENKLFYRKDHGRYVILNVPAARCLKLLLEESPGIVTQDIFITKVWSENGMFVSPNTLYQNISMVRRALREVSNKDINFIKTITRKGFQFNEQILIELTDDICDTAQLNNNIEAEEQNPTKYKSKYIYILSLLGAGICLMPLLASDELYSSKADFDNYSLITDYKGCSVFYENHDIDSSGLTNKLTNKIDYFGIDCKEKPVIYISTYSAGPEFTALLCKQQIMSGKKVSCESIHYRKDGEQ